MKLEGSGNGEGKGVGSSEWRRQLLHVSGKGGLLEGDVGLGRVFERWEILVHVSEPEGTVQEAQRTGLCAAEQGGHCRRQGDKVTEEGLGPREGMAPDSSFTWGREM